jgi:hypothetical protein
MKTTFLFSYLLFFSYSLVAQIAVDQNDMPSSGDTIRYDISNVSSFDPLQTGASFTWDFSTLSALSYRTDTFLTISQTPVVYNVVFNFLVANLACINQTPPTLGVGITLTDYYDFLKKASSNYSKVGFGASINGVTTPIKYDFPELYYAFPLNYNGTDSSTSSYGTTIPSYGYYGQTINRKYIVDGWGTLIIPCGTFPVLRVKTIINITDTIFSESFQMGYNIVRPTAYEYYWIAKKLPGHALKISQSGTVYSAEFLDSLNNMSVNNSDFCSSIKIFPNPASIYFTIQNQGAKSLITISLTDLSGKQVFEKELYETKCVIPVTDIPSGFYLLKMTSKSGSKTEKLAIIH